MRIIKTAIFTALLMWGMTSLYSCKSKTYILAEDSYKCNHLSYYLTYDKGIPSFRCTDHKDFGVIGTWKIHGNEIILEGKKADPLNIPIKITKDKSWKIINGPNLIKINTMPPMLVCWLKDYSCWLQVNDTIYRIPDNYLTEACIIPSKKIHKLSFMAITDPFRHNPIIKSTTIYPNINEYGLYTIEFDLGGYDSLWSSFFDHLNFSTKGNVIFNSQNKNEIIAIEVDGHYCRGRFYKEREDGYRHLTYKDTTKVECVTVDTISTIIKK